MLRDAGHDVELCVRRPLPHDGVLIDRGGRTEQVQLPILVDPADAAPVDWVLIATKSYDVPGAASWLRGLVGPDTTVVVLQNGVDHVARLRPWLPDGVRILPTVMYLGAELVEAGHAVWTYGDRVSVPAGADGERFAALLPGSPMRVEQIAEFRTAAWQKLLLNLAANSITALTGKRVEIFTDSGVRALARTVLGEAVEAGRAAGLDVRPSAVDDALAVIDDLPPTNAPSMLLDRLDGRRTEHELILGPVVRTADEYGTAAPITRALLTLLRAAAADRPAGRPLHELAS